MDTEQFAFLLTNVLMLVFLWSMNLGQGMSFTMQQIVTAVVVLGILSFLPFAVAVEWGKR